MPSSKPREGHVRWIRARLVQWLKASGEMPAPADPCLARHRVGTVALCLFHPGSFTVLRSFAYGIGYARQSHTWHTCQKRDLRTAFGACHTAE